MSGRGEIATMTATVPTSALSPELFARETLPSAKNFAANNSGESVA